MCPLTAPTSQQSHEANYSRNGINTGTEPRAWERDETVGEIGFPLIRGRSINHQIRKSNKLLADKTLGLEGERRGLLDALLQPS